MSEDTEADTNTLNMSDEDFLNMDFPSDLDESEIEEESQDTDESKEESSDIEEENTESSEDDSESPEGGAEEDEEEESEEESTNTEESDDIAEKASEEDTEDTENDSSAKLNKESNKDTIDYEAAYKQLTSPFKANGKEIQINNVDDAIALMQMGANYNKKMAGLKPNLKLIKMLENNGLIDESKLSYLIDLSKRNPDAIKKLLKDSNIDPMDLDLESGEYKPKTYTVNDKEVELDGILDDIRDTKSFSETLDIVSNKWDDSSKKVLLETPDIIKVINTHVESGIYQKISSVVESERMLGRLTGLTDIEAYRKVGEELNAKGTFNQKDTPESNSTPEPKTAKKIDPELAKKKKAAGTTRSTAKKTKVKDEFNPLALSDEEFEKLSANTYL